MQCIDAELEGLLKTVSVLSRKMSFGLADLERLTSLYNQAAYLFTYVEGNAKYFDTGVSFTVKAALLDDVELRGCLASRVRGLMAEANSVPSCWTRAIEWFLQSPEHVRAEAETRAAMSCVEDVLTRINRDRAGLLARLGQNGTMGSADALAAVLQRVTIPATRSKLLLAWHQVGKAYDDELATVMDRVVDYRWRHATALGYGSVADLGFASCGVSAETVRTFLNTFTHHALSERRAFLSRFEGAGALDDELRSMVLLDERRDGRDGGGGACIELGALLELITDTVHRVFGIVLSARRSGAGTIEGFDVIKGADAFGTLVLDRAVAGASALVIGRKGEPALPLHPRARLLCLMGSGEVVSFEAARQILHAMGHALIHVVARPRVPSASGLDILPLERLEGLSHWFEELVDNDMFQNRVAVTIEQRAVLKAYRRARDDRARNTRLEQAFVAAIDLDIHERRECSVRNAFDARIAEMGEPVGITFERTVRFMTAPLFRDHPGMGFVYPWGAAFGATQARIAVGAQSCEPSLAMYFDPAAAITVPDAGATLLEHPHSTPRATGQQT